MPQSFSAEVNISYTNTIKNIASFTNSLNAQVSELEKTAKKIKENESSLKSLMKSYKDLMATVKPYMDLERKRLTLLLKLEKAQEKTRQAEERARKAKEAQVNILSKTIQKYDQTYSAIRKYAKVKQDVAIMVQKEAITKQFGNQILEKEKSKIFGVTAALEKEKKARDKAKIAHDKNILSIQKSLVKYEQTTAASKRQYIAEKELKAARDANVISLERYNLLLKRFQIANGKAARDVEKLGAAARISQVWVHGLHATWKAFFALMAVQTFSRWVTTFAKTGENIELMTRKLNMFTGEANTLPMVSELATRVGIDFDILNKTLTRFAITTRGVFSTKEMLSWTENLVKAGRITGTTTQELRSGLLQLSQAMSAGRLMGDEYRSISENLPMLKQAIEDVFKEMGRGSEDLKTLSREGQITTEILVKSYEKLGVKISAYGNTWDTIDAAISRVVIQWQLFVYQMTKGNSVFKDFVNSIAASIELIREGLFGELSEEAEELIISGKGVSKTLKTVNNTFNDAKKATVELKTEYASFEEIASSLITKLLGVSDAVANSSGELEKSQKEWINVKELMESFSTAVDYVVAGLIAMTGINVAIWAVKMLNKITGFTKQIGFLYEKLSKIPSIFKTISYKAGVLAGHFLNLTAKIKPFLASLTTMGGLLRANLFAATVGFIADATINMVKHWHETKTARDRQIEFNKSILESEGKLKLYKNSISETRKEMSNFSKIKLEENIISYQKSIDSLVAKQEKMIEAKRKIEKQRIEVLEKTKGGNTQEANALFIESKKITQNILRMSSFIAIIGNKSNLAREAIANLSVAMKTAGDKQSEYIENLTPESEKVSDDVKKMRDAFASSHLQIISDMNEAIRVAKKNNSVKAESLAMEKAIASMALNRSKFEKDMANAANKTEKKDFNKLIQAEKELAEVRAAGIGGKQLEDAIKKVEKYNGVETARKAAIKATKLAKKELAKELEFHNKTLEFELRHMKDIDPLMAKYLTVQNELINKLKLKKIGQDEFNKSILMESKILEEAQKVKKDKELDDLTSKYSKLKKALKDYDKVKKEINLARQADIISLEEQNNLLYEQELIILKLKATMGDMSQEDQFFQGMKAGFYAIKNDSTSIMSEMETLTVKAFNGMTDAIVDFAMTGKMNFTDFANSVIEDMIRIMIQQSVTKPLAGLALDFIGGMIGGGLSSSFASTSMASSFTGSTFDGFATSSFTTPALEKGGTMSGSGISAYSNQIVSSPTVFPFAKGIGLMGEAGDEGIFPLTRMPSGNLGVEAKGSGSVENNVYVNITIDENGESESTNSDAEQGAREFGDMISVKVKQELLEEMRPGGMLNRM